MLEYCQKCFSGKKSCKMQCEFPLLAESLYLFKISNVMTMIIHFINAFFLFRRNFNHYIELHPNISIMYMDIMVFCWPFHVAIKVGHTLRIQFFPLPFPNVRQNHCSKLFVFLFCFLAYTKWKKKKSYVLQRIQMESSVDMSYFLNSKDVQCVKFKLIKHGFNMVSKIHHQYFSQEKQVQNYYKIWQCLLENGLYKLTAIISICFSSLEDILEILI